jgi:serine/threonine protein kinase
VFFAVGGPVCLLHGGMMPFLETRAPRSPEAHGTDVRDEAGDVFGLARLLARLSIGVDPFEAPPGSAPAHVVREDQLPRELPEGFRRFLTRSLAIDPSARIRRAEEFAADLRVIRASWASPAPERRANPGPGRLAAAVAILAAGVWAWSRGCSP